MKQQELLNRMTLEEKAAFLSGHGEWDTRAIKRLNIPAVFCSDGPHGIRKQAGAGDHLGLNESLPATCFPTAATIANSFNEELGKEIGKALGEEALLRDVQILLGPGLNIKRSPLCGRNFEYFSEDPYLSGKMAAAYIRGIQSQGVYACPKHFAVNSQELRRMAMNAIVDERTLREIYLTGFEIALMEGNAKAIMTSYNQVNGVYANENEHLLKNILRKEWGFDGVVITDWGGSNDHTDGVKAGSNLEMPAPGLDSARELLKAFSEKRLTIEELDACAGPLLDAVIELSRNKRKGHFDETEYFDEKAHFDEEVLFKEEAHHDLARRAAEESAVLLKNEDKVLPLAAGTKVAVIGDFALKARYQGAGSSVVNCTRLENIITEIGKYDLQIAGMSRGYKRTGEEDIRLQTEVVDVASSTAMQTEALNADSSTAMQMGTLNTDSSTALQTEALHIASGADVVLFFFGLDEISESEGMDRNHMRIPQNQIDLLSALSKVNQNIVGVLSAGAAIEMPWQVNCKALLHGYLTGQAGASAILNILTGKVNPSGRLNESYPFHYENTPAIHNFPSIERNAEYRESLYVGYRHYDTLDIKVQYPFGYGLSYTEFSYSNLVVSNKGVTVTVTNIGERAGAEVVQLYIGLPNAAVFRPNKELKGFKKVFLEAKESKTIEIAFDDKTFRYWNVRTNQWEIEQGIYKVMIGSNVSDIRLSADLEQSGTTTEYPYNPAMLPHYYNGLHQMASNEEFALLLGYPIPSHKWSGELELNDALCQMYYAKSALARFVFRRLTAIKKKSEDMGKPDLNILFIYNMTFRAMAKMTNGMISMEMARGMLLIVNGHFFKGMGKLINGFVKNKVQNRRYEKRLSRIQDGQKK